MNGSRLYSLANRYNLGRLHHRAPYWRRRCSAPRCQYPHPALSTVPAITFWLSKSLLEAAFGTTPGKMLTHLHVNHDIQGEHLSIYYSSARNVWILLEINPLVRPALFSFVAVFLVASCIRDCSFVGLDNKFANVTVLQKNEKHPLSHFKSSWLGVIFEGMTGIEPASSAWKAEVIAIIRHSHL